MVRAAGRRDSRIGNTEESGGVLYAEVVTSQAGCIVVKLRLLYGGRRDSVLYVYGC
jgi:hypothetical protein